MSGGEKSERARRVAHALGALFERTRVPVIAVERGGSFVAANDAAVAQYGYTLDELLEMRIHDLQASERSVDQDLARAHAGDDVLLDRRPHKRKDGSVLWVVPTAGPIDVEGESLVVSVLKDVTALVSAEERASEVTEHSRRNRRLMQSAVASMLGTPEQKAALTTLVEAFGAATGHAASVWLPERKGERTLKMIAAFESPNAPGAMRGGALDLAVEAVGGRAWEERQAILIRAADTRDGSMERAQSSRIGDRGFVAPLVGRAGTYGLIYGVLSADEDLEATLAIATTLGEFGGVLLEAIDLEERARRDEQRVELVWQSAVERFGSAFALLDRERRVVRVNHLLCELLKRDVRDVVGRRCFELFAVCRGADPAERAQGPDGAPIRCPHEIAVETGARVVQEVSGPISGRPLRIEVAPAPANEIDIASIHVTRDLSEERAVRSQLVTADRLATIGRLAAGVAHEVNNPAGFVTLALQLVKDQLTRNASQLTADTPGKESKLAEVVSMVDEAIEAMLQINQIMRDLTGFSRERARAAVDLTQVANSAIRLAAHETKGRATVERHFEEGLQATVRGARIAQVVLNLVVNAAQAIPNDGVAEKRIDVRVYRAGDGACIDVIDTGPGVPESVGDRIFEPFFTTREEAGGTGLGLWLSRSIIEEEGGTLTYENVKGGGACFRIALPLHRVGVSGTTAAAHN